jgi:LysM repeat protein
MDMNKKFYVLLIIVLIASLVLVACERPASKPPVITPTTEGEIPFPVATQPKIMQDILKGTQTAAALTQQVGGGVNPQTTGTPAFSIDTPEPTTEVVSTMVPFATPTPGRPATYVIQSGEFPYCIARRFNVDISELLTLNGMGLNSTVSIGQKLKIPQSGSFFGERALKKHPTTYTVVAGDTIGKIACSFGDADPVTIYAANGLAAGSALKAGQVLQIP